MPWETIVTKTSYRFEFEPAVSLIEAEMSLHLALFAVEGLYGEARVRLEVAYRSDELKRSIVFDAADPIGNALARIYIRLLSCEFGNGAFHVRQDGEGTLRDEAGL
jgi:hypothetical protein